MDENKIAAFYDDPVKLACDRFCVEKAFSLRSFCTDPRLRWEAMRLAKFALHWGRGTLRRMTATPAPAVEDAAPALARQTPAE